MDEPMRWSRLPCQTRPRSFRVENVFSMQIVFSVEAAQKRGPSGDVPVGVYQITFQVGCFNLQTLTTSVGLCQFTSRLVCVNFLPSWFVSTCFPAGLYQL
jgi:hypothetical protein